MNLFLQLLFLQPKNVKISAVIRVYQTSEVKLSAALIFTPLQTSQHNSKGNQSKSFK